MPEPDELLRLRSLVLGAFDAARAGAKPDWWRMQIGVLKNRILQATQQTFKETDFGFGSFTELVEAIPDLLQPVVGSHPPAVELTEPSKSTMALGGVPRSVSAAPGRLRSDLWRAVFDYSNEDGWVWNVESGVAIPWDGTSAAPLMPTVSAAILSDWRREFASNAAEETGYLDAVTDWAARGLPTTSLPKPIQSSWNAFLKAKSLERLTEWFDQHGILFPADSMERTTDVGRHHEHAGSEVRKYLRACIDAMTDEEIRAVTIPVEVALRVGR